MRTVTDHEEAFMDVRLLDHHLGEPVTARLRNHRLVVVQAADQAVIRIPVNEAKEALIPRPKHVTRRLAWAGKDGKDAVSNRRRVAQRPWGGLRVDEDCLAGVRLECAASGELSRCVEQCQLQPDGSSTVRVSFPEERHQGVDVPCLPPPAEIGTQCVRRRHEGAGVWSWHALHSMTHDRDGRNASVALSVAARSTRVPDQAPKPAPRAAAGASLARAAVSDAAPETREPFGSRPLRARRR